MSAADLFAEALSRCRVAYAHGLAGGMIGEGWSRHGEASCALGGWHRMLAREPSGGAYVSDRPHFRHDPTWKAP